MVGSVKAKKIRYTKTKKREFLIQQRARLTASPEENIRARGPRGGRLKKTYKGFYKAKPFRKFER